MTPPPFESSLPPIRQLPEKLKPHDGPPRPSLASGITAYDPQPSPESAPPIELAVLSEKVRQILEYDPETENLTPGENVIMAHNSEHSHAKDIPVSECKRRVEIKLGKTGKVEIHALSFYGEGGYTVNEDGVLISVSPDGSINIFVTDGSKGFGQAGAGLLATDEALSSFADSAQNNRSLDQALTQAAADVQNNANGGMATAVGIKITPNRELTRASQGDASIHAVIGNNLSITEIQNYADDQIRAGRLAPQHYYDARYDANGQRISAKSQITSALGLVESEHIVYEPEQLKPGQEVMFILASDALRDWISDYEISQLMHRYNDDLATLQEELFKLCYQRSNGKSFNIQHDASTAMPQRKDPNNSDNITIVVGRVTMPVVQKSFLAKLFKR